MCEVLAVAAPVPVQLSVALGWALKLERFGIAGFGWGVAWTSDADELQCYRRPSSLADDPAGRRQLEAASFSRALVHLRRPSRLSTVEMADTQPFVDEARRFAFVHNGRFERDREHRDRLAHLLRGLADSEVGFRLFESLLDDGRDPPALASLHAILGGTANLGTLFQNQELWLYSGHSSNTMYRFRVGELSVASTGLHSDDESLFDLVFPEAVEREVVGPDSVLLRSRKPRSTHGAPSP